MLTKRYLVEERAHPLLPDTVQYIYCFPSAYRFEWHGCIGLSIVAGGRPMRWEGAMLTGMTKDGYGGGLAHDGQLLPEKHRKWSKQFRSEGEANKWIRQAIAIYG